MVPAEAATSKVWYGGIANIKGNLFLVGEEGDIHPVANMSVDQLNVFPAAMADLVRLEGLTLGKFSEATSNRAVFLAKGWLLAYVSEFLKSNTENDGSKTALEMISDPQSPGILVNSNHPIVIDFLQYSDEFVAWYLNAFGINLKQLRLGGNFFSTEV
jgi:hypothetical protein